MSPTLCVRDWNEFFKAFSAPKNPLERVQANLIYFEGNYLLIYLFCLGIGALLRHTFLLSLALTSLVSDSPVFLLTYAFAQYLLPLEKRLYDVLLPYCKDDDASRKSVPFVESLTKFSGLDPDEEDEDEEKKEKEARMRKQTTLFLKHLQEQGCSTRQINQVISEVFLQKGRTHCLFYSDLFRDQDRFYLHSKHGRIPVVIMDNHRNYVGHIYVYEHERLVCEMRGIRVGLTRAISKGCQHQRDQNVAQPSWLPEFYRRAKG